MNAGRREMLVLGAAALLGIGESHAQPSPKRVIWLGNFNSRERVHARIGKSFASRGLVEGRDFTLTLEEIRGSSLETAEAQVDELVARQPDVIVLVAHWVLVLLKRRTRSIPIVFYNLASDPEKIGLVESLRRPGANFTGTTQMLDQIVSKQWQLLKEVKPSMKRGGRLWSEDDLPRSVRMFDELKTEERLYRELTRDIEARLGIEIVDIEVSMGASQTEVAAAVKRSKADALLVGNAVPDSLVEFLKTTRIPACAYFFGNVKKGVLLGVSFEWDEGETQAALMAARILRGESPATIPIYRTNRHFVGVNMRTARAMGIEIPASILLQATLVVE
jgi:putative ABC transport system substrate-binding protein